MWILPWHSTICDLLNNVILRAYYEGYTFYWIFYRWERTKTILKLVCKYVLRDFPEIMYSSMYFNFLLTQAHCKIFMKLQLLGKKSSTNKIRQTKRKAKILHQAKFYFLKRKLKSGCPNKSSKRNSLFCDNVLLNW